MGLSDPVAASLGHGRARCGRLVDGGSGQRRHGGRCGHADGSSLALLDPSRGAARDIRGPPLRALEVVEEEGRDDGRHGDGEDGANETLEAQADEHGDEHDDGVDAHACWP